MKKKAFSKTVYVLIAIAMLFSLVQVGLAAPGTGDGPGGVGNTTSGPLVLWLKADEGVFSDTCGGTAAVDNADVVCWEDQSASGIDVTQSTAANKPDWQDGIAALNSQPYLNFDGGDFLDGGLNLNLSDITVFAVYVPTAVATDQRIISKGYDGTDTAWELGTTTWGGHTATNMSFLAYPQEAVETTTGLTNGTAQLVVGIYDSVNDWSIYTTGAAPEDTDTDAGPNSNPTRYLYVGAVDANGTASHFWQGYIAEIIVYNETLTDAQRIIVQNYLGAKYDLDLGANDLYRDDPDFDDSYIMDIVGIGRGTDANNHGNATSGELNIENIDFLNDAGDFILFGHNGTTPETVFTDLPAEALNRWAQDWWIHVTQSGSTGGTVDLCFDTSELPLGTGTYYLLGRSGTTGNFDVRGEAVGFNGGEICFLGVDVDASLGSYFTIGRAVPPVEAAVDNPVTTSAESLPSVGFAPNQVTELAAQPAEKAYAPTDIVLEIPQLGVEANIVGVPFMDGNWDVSWLGNSVGYLQGTAFPTWSGNTVLAGHVYDANNNPGLFANLKDLKYGDQFQIHAFGQVYTYEVRSNTTVRPYSLSVLGHSDYDVVTLLTCEDWSANAGFYKFRRAVQAVLISVSAE